MRVFLGFDRTESAAYWICRASILKHAPSVDVYPLDIQHLRMMGVYDRPDDPLASTEFTYSRFLVPYLCGFEGWALFMDSDMLARADIRDLFEFVEPEKALYCVQHDYTPRETEKMDGKTQTRYPRKNWSSFVLWNCGHPDNRTLTPDVVNTQTGAFLHRFQWLDDNQIGALPVEWNWLEGWNSEPDPKVVHYTRGIPGIHEFFETAPHADEWFACAREMFR